MQWVGRLFRKRRSGVVAVMTAVMAPVLIGFAALAVDGGYWVGSQVALQAQANAGALAGLRAQSYGLTSTAAIQTIANQASIAANSAIATPTISSSVGTGSVSVTAQNGAPVYLAQILGISSFQLGATAAAGGVGINKTTAGCLIAFDKSAAEAIYVHGGATITAQNCGVISDSSATSTTNGDSNAIVAEPSGKIIAPGIMAVGGIYANTGGGAYIGGASGQPSVVVSGASLASDPLAAMGDPPAIPAMPAFPANGTTTNVATTGYSFAYVAAYSQSWGGCGNYTGSCYANAGSFDGFSTNASSFTFNTGSATPNGSGIYTIYGQTSLGGSGPVQLDAGTYYLQGDLKSGSVSDYALTANVPQFTIQDGTTLYANGGFDFTGSGSDPFYFGTGFYYFSAAPGAGYAFTANVNHITFAGGTYIFNGGLDISAQDSVTFGPGIYIIANGNLNVGGGASITANGATFILEDGAGFSFSGGSSAVSLSAPTTNCVQPSSYPLSSYISAAPYDGTNGKGICGILIYQARNDAAADSLTGSSTIGINGIIYAPATNLSLVGNTSISTTVPANFNFELGILVNTVAVSGSSSINLQASPGSPLNDVTYTVSQPILTQ